MLLMKTVPAAGIIFVLYDGKYLDLDSSFFIFRDFYILYTVHCYAANKMKNLRPFKTVLNVHCTIRIVPLTGAGREKI